MPPVVLDDGQPVGATQLEHPCLTDPEVAGCLLPGDPVGAGLVVLELAGKVSVELGYARASRDAHER